MKAPRINAFDAPSDAIVAEILSDRERRQDELRLTADERKKLVQERKRQEKRAAAAQAKAASQADQRTLLLLPVELKAKLEALANELKCPVSQVATFLLFSALEREQDFGAHLSASYSPRYEHELIHPKDAERAARRIEQKQKKGWG